MFKNVSRRLPSVCSTLRRGIIHQPACINQGLQTAPIFINPPTFEDKVMGDAIRESCLDKGVDVDYLDLKAFQIRHENHEFDTPAYPRTESACWGYIWGNELVKNSVLLETLKPEDEYLRGFLEKTTEEFSRKMIIHYRSIDWQTRKEKCLQALKATPDTWSQIYSAAKVEATAQFIQEDPDAYSNLFRNNSYIGSYEEGDTFGYNIPADLESKIEGLMKFEFDRTSGSGVDLSPYVSMLTSLSGVAGKMTGGASGASVADFAKGYMSASTADLATTVSFFESASASLMGTVPSRTSDKVGAVLAFVKSADQRVAAIRGMASSSETAAIKGKTDADLAVHFNDACEQRLDLLCQLTNFCKNVSTADSAQVLVAALFNNYTDMFTQFAVDPENTQKFVSTNGGAFDKAGESMAAQKAASAAVAKGLDFAKAEIAQWMQTNLNLDKPSLAAASEQVSAIFASSGTSSTSWAVTAAGERVANTTGLDKVEAQALHMALSNPGLSNVTGHKLLASLMCPPVGSYSGCTMKSAAAGLDAGTFSANVATHLSAYLSSTGGATPTQADLVESKISSLPVWRELGKTAKAAHQCYQDTDAAMASVKWWVEDTSIPALRQAAFGMPHPSYNNVNCY